MPRKSRKQTHDVNLYKELFMEWRLRKITDREMILLAVIDSYIGWLYYSMNDPDFEDYVRTHLHKKHGAWITDKKISMRVDLTPKTISNMLTDLSNKGYIFRTILKKNGYSKRFIKTCWTDTLLEQKSKRKS